MPNTVGLLVSAAHVIRLVVRVPLTIKIAASGNTQSCVLLDGVTLDLIEGTLARLTLQQLLHLRLVLPPHMQCTNAWLALIHVPFLTSQLMQSMMMSLN